MQDIKTQKTFLLLLAIVGMSLIFNCTGEKNVTGFSSNSQSYYPLGVGYTWYYDLGTSGEYTILTTVEKKFIETSKTYFIMKHGSTSIENYSVSRDTVYQDDRGRIWKRVHGKDRLWLDFTLDDGGTYGFQRDTICNYTVIVNRDISIHTPGGSFDNCSEYLFFDSTIVDSQQWLYFAPGVGLVKEMFGEGPTTVLYSYHD